MTKYEVIDDFLPKEQFSIIEGVFMGKVFPWFYEPGVSAKSKVDKNNIYMYHLIYQDWQPNSPQFDLLLPLLTKLEAKAISRIKANFYPGTPVQHEHGMHSDYNWPHKGALYSINTCDGYTKLEDGTKIKSVANRMLLFDASKPHTSATCTDANARINININYF